MVVYQVQVFVGISQRRVPKLKRQEKKLGEKFFNKTLYMLSINFNSQATPFNPK